MHWELLLLIVLDYLTSFSWDAAATAVAQEVSQPLERDHVKAEKVPRA